jgi:hypothetical protein
MRTAAAIFVAMHGVGHVIWFMCAWTPSVLGKIRRAGFLSNPNGMAGKALGVISLIALIGFAVSAWGIWTEVPWWPPLLVGSVAVSVPVLLAFWNPVGTVSFNALLADIALGAATLMPWGERLPGSH